MGLTKAQQVVYDGLLSDIAEALEVDITNESMVELSGPAGVGKSYLTSTLIKELHKRKLKVAVTTPTHSSLEVIKNIASGLDDVYTGTIHAFLNLRINNDFNTGKTTLKKEKVDKPNKADILFVDEKSMVGEDLFDYITESIDSGNIQCVVFVGDKYQLPVVNGKMFNLDVHSYELTEIVRQAEGSPIIQLATDFRKCIELKKYPKISLLLERYKEKIKITNNIGDFLNEYSNDKNDFDFRVIGSYTNEMVNVYNNGIRNAMFPNKDFLEVGDKVVLQEPNVVDTGDKFKKTLHTNGQTVELVGVNKKTKKIKGKTLKYYNCSDSKRNPIDILDPASSQDYHSILEKISSDAKKVVGEMRRDKWEEYFSIKEEFVDVKYPMSMTIHKLQGSSYQSVYLDIRDLQASQGKSDEDDDFLFRLMYVGITRSSDKLVILSN